MRKPPDLAAAGTWEEGRRGSWAAEGWRGSWAAAYSRAVVRHAATPEPEQRRRRERGGGEGAQGTGVGREGSSGK